MAKNYEVHHICVGTTHKETHWKMLDNMGWGKKMRQYSVGGYIDSPQCICTYNTQVKIPLNKEQTPKQWRTTMKSRSHLGKGTNRRGRVKEGSKEGKYDWYTFYTRMNRGFLNLLKSS
jgi:hypothetical protein